MNHERPQSRQLRNREQAVDRPQLRLIRVREQSASASSPRQQARNQSVHIRGNDAASTGHDPAVATDKDTPEIDRDSEIAFARFAPLTSIERGNKQAKRCPIHRITVDILPPISFLVRIRRNPVYVLL